MNIYNISDITIVITCFKEGELIYRAVDSILNQTIHGFEILLINDCSPNLETNMVCEHIKKEHENINYHRREKNGGLSASRNDGFRLMKNKIAVFLDADDTLPPDVVESILEAFNREEGIEFVFGNVNIIDPITKNSMELLNNEAIANNGYLDPVKLAHNWILAGVSPILKETALKAGGYSSKYTYTVQDVDLWRRVVMMNAKGGYINKIIYNWYRGNEGMNASVKEADYLPLRIDSLPFYDKYNSSYAFKMRDYIYRYFSSRLMVKDLNEYLEDQKKYYSPMAILKAKLMYIKPLYRALRIIKNKIK